MVKSHPAFLPPAAVLGLIACVVHPNLAVAELSPADELSWLVYQSGSYAGNSQRYKRIFTPEELAHAKDVLQKCYDTAAKATCDGFYSTIIQNQRRSAEWNKRADAQMAAEGKIEDDKKSILAADEHCSASEADKREIAQISDTKISRIYRLVQAGENEKVCSETPAVVRAVDQYRSDLAECADYLANKHTSETDVLSEEYLDKAARVNLVVKDLQQAEKTAGCP